MFTWYLSQSKKSNVILKDLKFYIKKECFTIFLRIKYVTERIIHCLNLPFSIEQT